MKLYIIRHGETDWNKQYRFQGQTDIDLNEEGLRLARLTGEHMKDIPLDLIISSPLHRAIQTAELVTAGRDIPMVIDPRIIEISFGDWEGECSLTSSVLPAEFLDKFYHDPYHCMRAPHGEDFHDVIRRTGDFYQSLLNNPDYSDLNILISTHGAASRCLLENFYEDKIDIWRGGVPRNCSVSIVEIKNKTAVLIEKDHLFY